MNAVQIGRLVVLALALAGISCGSVVRDGAGTSFLIVDSLTGSGGANTLRSDVSLAASDSAIASLSLGLKDPTLGTGPSQNQFITLDRYRVRYTRADGRNTPGVDVPFGFDGAIAATVTSGSTPVVFTIVRQLAKEEAPLRALRVNDLVISTIADVTFYGRDLTGREASVSARVSVDFGNFTASN